MKKRAANNALKFRDFNNPIEVRWDVWLVNGEKVSIKADRAHYKDGVLTLALGPATVACIVNFKAAEQFACGGFGFETYLINDGVVNHYVEANAFSWNTTIGEIICMQHNNGKCSRLVAVFKKAHAWMKPNSLIWDKGIV